MGYKRETYVWLNHFDKFIETNYHDAVVLDEEIVHSWLKKRDAEKFITVNSRAGQIRLFARYLVSQGYDAYILSTNYSTHKTNYVPHIFSDQELSEMFIAADNMKIDVFNKFKHIQFPVMIKLTYCCGLRPIECRLLKSKNVDLDNGILLIKGTKKPRDRYVPMASGVTKMCKKYNNDLQKQLLNSEFFFPSQLGNPYSRRWFNFYFRKLYYSIYPNSKASIYPYCLRHRFATAVLMKWLNEGVDINSRLPYLRSYMTTTQ
ncbi:MAG: tyrosine-type recombinase/integrase [Deltaproteobacteria bacterium]|nr:tyrosine-type recombinase/integrase [Deltaproteobacteria bacterium]